MLGTSASLVIIVYGERDSHPLGSKRSISMIPCIAIYGKRHSYALGSKRPFLPYVCLIIACLYPKLNKCATALYIV